MNIAFTLNGKSVSVDVEPEKRLIDIIRENFQLTKAKAGCYAGSCGACSILVDGQLACSCLLPAFTARGLEVVTIEGFSKTREYSDILKAFSEANYTPCSYCAGGRVLAIEALLSGHPDPTEEEIMAGMAGITCQCADYSSLLKAVGIAAFSRKMRRRGRRT